jgi:hypothetical protein
MSLVKAARADKKIIAHLVHGGSIEDSVAHTLITGLLRESLENKAIANAVAFHRIPVELLVRAYQESFLELLPHPLIRHGTIILVPSLPFIDEDNFPMMLDGVCSVANYSPDNLLSEDAFVAVMVHQAKTMRDLAAKQGRVEVWPPADFPTLPEIVRQQQTGCLGCLGVIVFGIIGAIGLTAYWIA